MAQNPSRSVSQLEKLAAAFERRDYRTAAQLLKGLMQESPKHPWVQFYAGRMHEVTGKFQTAEQIYRQLLQHTTSPKLALQARQGLQRLELNEQTRRKQAIAQATADPARTEPGFLILQPVTGTARPQAVQNFARIMRLDPQVVRLRLPAKGWQLYRTGPIGELQVYGQELQQNSIPSLWVSQKQVEAIQVFRVCYFKTVEPQVTIVCQSSDDQLGSLTFDWSEVTQLVRGQLPIFEKVLDSGAWGKLERRERTQDYAQVCDLHLPGRNCIVRICDMTYQFQEGVLITEQDQVPSLVQATTRINWNCLMGFLQQKLPRVPTWSDFKAFGESSLDHRLALLKLKSQFDLPRKQETVWDPAFHLYSALCFLQPPSSAPSP